MVNCYCNSQKPFQQCCESYIKGVKNAPTAEALMRSRYSAYAIHNADYLVETTYFSERKYYPKADILLWATSNKWQKLEIIKSTETTVEFKAFYIDSNSQPRIHHEHSSFKLEKGKWYYVDGEYY